MAGFVAVIPNTCGIPPKSRQNGGTDAELST